MIDDKKIEEAARRNADKYRNYPTLSDEDRYKVSICSFMEGTKWIKEEFLKNLWHYSNKEKPQIGKPILAYTMYGYETLIYNGEGEIDCGTNWNDIVSDMAVASWCYIDDIHKK